MAIDWQRIGENLGSTAMALAVAWRLVNKWAGQFLLLQRQQAESGERQAAAIAALAGAVGATREDQREVLIAVRVLAEKMDRQKESLAEIGRKLQDDRDQEAKKSQ
jgi:hypothetical protein